MTREDQGHYAKKHGFEKDINQALADRVKTRAVNGSIPCAVAFDIAGDLGVTPKEVGFTIDMLEIKLIKCQLGLFGYGAAKKAPQTDRNRIPALEQAIRDELREGASLSCSTAWEIARKQAVGKRDVSAACDILNVKIRPCQLGAF
jgi:hypothetical protein